MRDGPSAETLAGAAGWWPSIAAWKGGAFLADVPVLSGTLDVDASAQVPERLTFTVPEWSDGRSWVPDSSEHPLASLGQFVTVDIHVQSSVTEDVTTTRLGRFQVQGWSHNDSGTVDVECVGMLQKALDDRFRTPQVPRPTDTLGSALRRFTPAGLPVSISTDLMDRVCPQSFQWDDDRLGAMYEIADAWPVRLRVNQHGALQVLPPLPAVPEPVVTLTDGERGTVVSAPRQGSRDGIANVVVATSSADDSAKAPLWVIREVTDGPMTPANYGPVVFFWSSPLASTLAQLEASAATILARKVRPALVQVVSCAPDPRIETDDAIQVIRDGYLSQGFVNAYSLPLTLDGGDMTVTVSAVGDPVPVLPPGPVVIIPAPPVVSNVWDSGLWDSMIWS